MKTIQIVSILLALSLNSCKSVHKADMEPSNEEATEAITAVLHMQEIAWSEGNIEKFMEGYWKSDDLTFIGKRGLTYGWNTTYYNYKKGYPSKNAMGKLQFEIYEMTRLAPDAYQVIGKYTLIREIDQPTGYFSLIWRYLDGKWVIVSDHTSG